jgi:hypothetical protein
VLVHGYKIASKCVIGAANYISLHLSTKTVTCRALVGKPEGKRQFGRPMHKWEDNNKMDLQEAGWGLDWTDVARDRHRLRAVVYAVMNLRIP